MLVRAAVKDTGPRARGGAKRGASEHGEMSISTPRRRCATEPRRADAVMQHDARLAACDGRRAECVWEHRVLGAPCAGAHLVCPRPHAGR
jgi:hypothetical protein